MLILLSITVIAVVVTVTDAQLPDLGYTGFNCLNAGPSSTVPTDVNRVRPGDITVIGAIGDSLTASMGAGATSQAEYGLDYRGMSYAMGGETNLESHVTIPNILKTVSPQLFGQSLGTGYVNNWNMAQLNAAIDGQKAEDLIPQARDLVAKMNAHGVDVQNSWKLITVFIGTNDVNAFCNDGDPLHNAANYSLNIQRALTVLQQNLPRTIVNLVSMQNWELWERAGALGGCPHMEKYPMQSDSKLASLGGKACDRYELVLEYQIAVEQIQNNRLFDLPDFTVIVQPFWLEIRDPALRANGTTDPTFWSLDCFHYSNRGNAIIAKMLWNNMMEPAGTKTVSFNLSDPSWPLHCPDPDCPYIRTLQNSLIC